MNRKDVTTCLHAIHEMGEHAFGLMEWIRLLRGDTGRLREQLWALRKLCGVSAEDMAAGLGVDRETLDRLEGAFGPHIAPHRERYVATCLGWEPPASPTEPEEDGPPGREGWFWAQPPWGGWEVVEVWDHPDDGRHVTLPHDAPSSHIDDERRILHIDELPADWVWGPRIEELSS